MVQARISSGPPYVSTTTASVGGRPTVHTDIPVCAVLLFLYLVGAATNMSIYQLNRRKGHKFLISWAMFGFCMARVVTCMLRLVWATRPNNIRVGIAAQVFVNAGVLVVYIVVLLLAQRVFRATHPRLGWNRPFGKTLQIFYYLLLIALLLVIGFTILTFYTLNPKLRSIALWTQRGSILYIMIFNVVSLALLLLSSLLPRASNNENFGTKSMGSKLIVLGVATFFCIFIAGFRTGTSWAPARSVTKPGWYDTKPAFYVIIFGFEIIIVYWFLFMRIDKMFWVPNGSNKPGDYSRIDLDGSTAKTTPEQEQDRASSNDKGPTEDKVSETV